jgi:hypothetical protein
VAGEEQLENRMAKVTGGFKTSVGDMRTQLKRPRFLRAPPKQLGGTPVISWDSQDRVLDYIESISDTDPNSPNRSPSAPICGSVDISKDASWVAPLDLDYDSDVDIGLSADVVSPALTEGALDEALGHMATTARYGEDVGLDTRSDVHPIARPLSSPPPPSPSPLSHAHLLTHSSLFLSNNGSPVDSNFLRSALPKRTQAQSRPRHSNLQHRDTQRESPQLPRYDPAIAYKPGSSMEFVEMDRLPHSPEARDEMHRAGTSHSY